MKADTDRAVADLAAAHDRLAAALYAVDVHPAQALLRGVDLRGATAQLWSGVDLGRLWAGFVAARDVLDRLRDLTGRTRDADAARILAARVPADPVDGLPDLSPAAFIAELERQCAATVDVLDRIGAARAALTERLIELDTALEAAVAAHHRLGADHTPTTGPLQQRLQQVYAQAVPDPLTVDETAWTALREELTRTVRQLSELAALRTALPARLTRLDLLLDALAAAEQRAHRAGTPPSRRSPTRACPRPPTSTAAGRPRSPTWSAPPTRSTSPAGRPSTGASPHSTATSPPPSRPPRTGSRRPPACWTGARNCEAGWRRTGRRRSGSTASRSPP
ncbi:hypothetical protein [Dactylosporangium cerinum]